MTSKPFQVKKNHHYVWGHYLARWSDDGKNVWHTTQAGKVVRHSVKSFCKEDYFYKVDVLTPAQLKIIHYLSSQSPQVLQDLHKTHLSDALKIQQLETALRDRGQLTAEVSEVIHAMRCNMLENMHAAHESDAKPIIDSLVKGDISAVRRPEHLIKFTTFLGHQLTRTKSFRNTVALAADVAEISNISIDDLSGDINKCWWFISYMFGMNIGMNLYCTKSKDRHCLLINNTPTKFITSDQPIINLHPDIHHGNIVPLHDNQCDLLIPLAPNAAFMINRSDQFPDGKSNISEDFANKVNEKIAEHAEVYTVGASRECLSAYKRLIGKRRASVQAFLLPGAT